MYYKRQLYKWLLSSLSHASVPRSRLASVFVILLPAERTGRVSVRRKSLAAALFLRLYSEDKQYEVRWLFKPTNATWATSRGGRKVPGSVYAGQFTPSCGDSCGRSRWLPLRTGTKGPRRSTRSAPLCAGRGWCGSARRPGSTTPWVGSSAERGCRSWSMPVCWPSEGFPVRTATERGQNKCHNGSNLQWVKLQNQKSR